MITIISGTNRHSRYIDALGAFYQDLFKAKGMPSQMLFLRDLPREIAFHFPENPETVVPGLKDFQEKIDQSNALVFLVPEYNGSLPGVLKLFIDCCRFPDSFAGRDIALAGISSGMFGNLRGLDHLDAVLSYLRGKTMPYRVHIPQVEKKISDSGEIIVEAIRDIIAKQVDEIAKIHPAQ